MPPKGWKSLKVPNAVVKPTKVDIGWAAGFIEGEGSFKKIKTTPRIEASQVNREPVLRLQRLFGGSLKHYHNHKPTWCHIWHWYVNGARALECLDKIFPLLSKKRKKQARKIL